MRPRHIIYIVLGLALAICLVLILKFYKDTNPLDSPAMPKCAFYMMTGYKCPGCGSQRALHYLLNGQVWESFKQNPLLYFAMVFIGMLMAFQIKPIAERFPKIDDFLSGTTPFIIMLASIFLFWIGRNLV